MSAAVNSGKTITPNFKHRLDGDLSSPRQLADIIGGMTFRAKGILDLVSVNLGAGDKASDDIVQAAVMAAIEELNDIQAVIEAFHDVVCNQPTPMAGGEK